jgi:hypothetical protein
VKAMGILKLIAESWVAVISDPVKSFGFSGVKSSDLLLKLVNAHFKKMF